MEEFNYLQLPCPSSWERNAIITPPSLRVPFEQPPEMILSGVDFSVWCFTSCSMVTRNKLFVTCDCCATQGFFHDLYNSYRCARHARATWAKLLKPVHLSHKPVCTPEANVFKSGGIECPSRDALEWHMSVSTLTASRL
jgi:hypothetical protein